MYALAAILALGLPGKALAGGRIAIDVDARLELAGAIQSLALAGASTAAPAGFHDHAVAYTRALAADLRNHRGDPAVAGQAAVAGLSFSDRSQILLRLSPPPELAERLTVQYALADKAGGRPALDRWLEGLRGFSRASGFPEILARRRALLEPALARFREREAKIDFLGKIEAYAGLPLIGTYSVFLSPFDAPGGVANSVAELGDGRMDISSAIGPELREGDLDFWTARVPGTLWHESAHGVLDGLADIYADVIARDKQGAQDAGWDCYGQWRQCVREHLVRAVMLRLLDRELGRQAAQDQLAFETEHHAYPYLLPMLDSLRLYEAARDRYPTLADFYPSLLTVFPNGKGALPEAWSPPDDLGPAQRKRLGLFLDEVLVRAKDPAALARARAARQALERRVQAPSPAPPARVGTAARRDKAVSLFGAGDGAAALAELDAVLAEDPVDAEAWMDRGVVLQSLKRPQPALESHGRAIALLEKAPPSGNLLADALTSRASLLQELGRTDEAAADLARALGVSAEAWPAREQTKRRLKDLRP